MITKGIVTHGFLGVAPADLSPDEQDRYGVKAGALVTAVTDASPAANAGLQVEDVITRFDDQPIMNAQDLRDAVAKAAPGLKASLTVVRSGKEQSLQATLSTVPDSQAAASPDLPQGRLGLRVADLTPEIARRAGIDPNARGAVVVEVLAGSPAADAGIQPGNLLVRINGRAVSSASQAEEVIRGLKQRDNRYIDSAPPQHTDAGAGHD